MPAGPGPGRTSFASPVTSSSNKAPHSSYASSPHSSSVKKRTSHACDRCRVMRTKCSGGNPCTRCNKDDAICQYGDHKRERNKKDLVESVNRVQELETENRTLVSTLRRMVNRSEANIQEDSEVLQLLSKYSDDEQQESSRDSRSQSQSAISSRHGSLAKSEIGGECNTAASIGSPGRQGQLNRLINLDHGAGAAGYIGKMAAMSWMTRCREHLEQQPGPMPMDFNMSDIAMHLHSTTEINVYLDDQDSLSVNEDLVDPLQWPRSDIAVILTEAYFFATRGAIPLLIREQFLDTMYNFPHASSLSWSQRRWLSHANLVWAIGSRWLHMSKLNTHEPPESHLEYYARARALGLDHRMMLDSPDVDVLQGIGLLAFYLLTNGSVTRAWNAVGDAARQAMSLGLHLRVVDSSVSALEQNKRARIWFSLYKLHASIVEITGRPGLIRTSYVTLPPEKLEFPTDSLSLFGGNAPNPNSSFAARDIWLGFLNTQGGFGQDIVKEVTASIVGVGPPSNFFIYDVRLCQLSEEIADSLYVDQQQITWSQTQRRIDELQQSLDAWAGTLPAGMSLTGPFDGQANPQASIQLAMYVCSLTMILHRPCLCEIHIRKESDQSKAFNLHSARSCVQAALLLVKLMPNDISTSGVFQSLPWWTLLHYLCQAGSIIVLEFCLDTQHFPENRLLLVEAMWKIMFYLSCLTDESISAYKAWRIFQRLLLLVGERYGDGTMFHFAHEPPPPTRWTQAEEEDLIISLQ